MSRGNRGRAQRLNRILTSDWVADGYRPPETTARDLAIADEATRLYATGDYACLLAAVIEAEQRLGGRAA